MPKYTPIDSENLLVESEGKPSQIHHSFFDLHVMNLVDDTDMSDYTKDNFLAKMREDYKARLDAINIALDSQHIFKYIDIRNLEYWLKAKKLFWDRVSDSWEDPYENYFLKGAF